MASLDDKTKTLVERSFSHAKDEDDVVKISSAAYPSAEVRGHGLRLEHSI